MLAFVKTALGLTKTDYDVLVQAYIDDCISELTTLGIYRDELENDKQILSAVIFYVSAQMTESAESDKWMVRYRDKVTKLLIASGYGNND